MVFLGRVLEPGPLKVSMEVTVSGDGGSCNTPLVTGYLVPPSWSRDHGCLTSSFSLSLLLFFHFQSSKEKNKPLK